MGYNIYHRRENTRLLSIHIQKDALFRCRFNPPGHMTADLLKLEEFSVIVDKLNRAKKLLLEQKYTASLNIIFDILDHDDPNNADAKFLLGKAYFLSGRTDLSVNTLMRLVKKHYNYPQAFYYLGKNFESLGLSDKALWAYERSVQNLNNILLDPHKDELQKSKLTSVLGEVVNIVKKLRSTASS